jgi:hypothetical protein
MKRKTLLNKPNLMRKSVLMIDKPKKKKKTKADKEILRKMVEFINQLDEMKVIRTRWFNIFIYIK